MRKIYDSNTLQPYEGCTCVADKIVCVDCMEDYIDYVRRYIDTRPPHDAPQVPSPSAEEAVDKALESIHLSQCAWEDSEDIMTVDGKPIGATISCRLEIDRWWPALKREIRARVLGKGE